MQSEFTDFVFVLVAIGALVTIFAMLLHFGNSRNKAQVKMKAIEKGIPLEMVDQTKTSYERMAASRRNGLIAIMAGLGLMFPFLWYSLSVGDPTVFVGGVFGLIPIFVGIGLLIDARLRRQDLENTSPSMPATSTNDETTTPTDTKLLED